MPRLRGTPELRWLLMAQRLRITFSRGGVLRYLSHLETMKMWERVFRRANWRLSYSQGFNPHPKISFAAALPVGVSGEAELMEVWLEEPRGVESAAQELNRQVPAGTSVLSVDEVRPDAPGVQKLLKAAEYRASLAGSSSAQAIRKEIERALAASNLPRERKKEGKIVRYDLRPMIHSLRLDEADASARVVYMELRTDTQGAGRADEVLRELGIEPADCAITRVRLILDEGRAKQEERDNQDGRGGQV